MKTFDSDSINFLLMSRYPLYHSVQQARQLWTPRRLSVIGLMDTTPKV